MRAAVSNAVPHHETACGPLTVFAGLQMVLDFFLWGALAVLQIPLVRVCKGCFRPCTIVHMHARA